MNLVAAVSVVILLAHGNAWAAVLTACVWSAGLTWWLLAQLIGPVKTLCAAVDAMAAGDYRRPIEVPNRDELGALAGALDRMSRVFDSRLTQLTAIADRQLAVLDAMVEGIISVDSHQRVELANPAAGRLFNFRPESAQGRTLLQIVRNEALSEAAQQGISSGEFQRLEINFSGREQSTFNIHVQPLPGTPCPGLVLVMHDITALRRLESHRQEFIANVSHELKTPLTSIRAYTETLRHGGLHDHEASERFLSRIDEQSERLYRLIMDMLSLARIESEPRNLELDSVDVPKVAMECLEEHRHAAAAKGIFLEIEAGLEDGQRGPNCNVRADRDGLRQILENLLDNAVKYTPKGGNISLGWQSDGEVLHIRVRDSGIGIKRQDQQRVFERFYRVDRARSRELGGTGLGLAIVKHLVHSFGGTVSLESQPGHGSTFIISLPRG